MRALTAVAGNVPLDLTERNARIIRDWAGRTKTLPVYAGCPRPLVRDLVTAANVHGKTEPKASSCTSRAHRLPPVTRWRISSIR